MRVDYAGLKAILVRKRIKQWELAQKLGIHEAKLSKIMTGRVEPDESMVRKICKVLDIPETLIIQKK